MEFSFMLADTNNSRSLKIGESAYVPIPGGGFYHTQSYNGDGIFGNQDIYELVVDWNENDLSVKMLDYPSPGNYGSLREFANAKRAYERLCSLLEDIKSKSIGFLLAKYGSDYKHNLGIAIAGTDEKNLMLKYPIKVSETQMEYDILPPSVYDINQGLDLVRETTEEWHSR